MSPDELGAIYRNVARVDYPTEREMVKHPEHPDPETFVAYPCPFCSDATQVRILKIKTRSSDFGKTWVYCSRCTSSGPVADSDAAALELWNSRSTVRR